VAGLNLYAAFLTREDRCTLDDVLRHVEHFCSLGGQENIALGCDFDGCESMPAEIGSAADMGKLYEALLKANYPERVVRGIFTDNLLRVVKEVLR